MAHSDLKNAMSTLSLREPNCLLFNPSGDMAWIREKFQNISRYLMRISTPWSDGLNDEVWVKSKAATYRREDRNLDIFAIEDKEQAAAALNRYLRWEGTTVDADNMISWTSSPLLALHLANIKLCIVDTAALPEGVFLPDMDLIDAYRGFNARLQDLKELRTRKHKSLTGSYYFGEYLSQGALKIGGNCQIVSAQALVDKGLFLLQPEFCRSMEDTKPQWANEMTNEELQAVTDIAQLFGPRWRLPMATNLMALQPRREGDSAILRTLRATPFTGLMLPSFSSNNANDCRRGKRGVLTVKDECGS
ncbi:uncharacterized protein BDZ99DRAFT_487548 [Mytilinidion resinicola]|uniref:Uncharacterized protein n=1 Tax=Mytilinidion resinicola TaxID=574789 RepID=A0A6A6YP58_9PEZI|nr:uncharacterized protein BDZ99DRAFT_487548 [Mytilinidion resinicola]KAF2810662.1 hypothetical protein BDZ99DRAFT_487548 [Mytilinidion resinicola]